MPLRSNRLLERAFRAGLFSRGSAPPTLSYATPQSWTYGVAITPVAPTFTGSGVTFAVVSGSLPTGVTVHATTGVISGTPTLSKVAANVTIRATNAAGTADAVVNVAVPSPLYTSLVDYWNLDEASGTRVGSHAGLNLTDNNTVTSQATGGPDGGRCAQFTAANSEGLSRASEAALQIGDIDSTFVVHAYLDSAAFPMRLISKEVEYVVQLLGAALIGRGTGAGWVDTPTSTLNLTGGVWGFLAAWVDVAGAKLNISLDNGTTQQFNKTGAYGSGANALEIGNGAAQFFDGRMAYLAIWTRVLTANERTWLYNAGAGRAYAALATYDGG